MASFTDKLVDHLRHEAAPLVLSFAMLPSGGLAQVNSKPEAVPPDVAAAARNTIRGTDECTSSYPQPVFDKDGAAKPYSGFMACGGAGADFYEIADGIIIAMKNRNGKPPEKLVLEFNAGTKDAKTVEFDGGKLRDIIDEFIKRGIGPDENRNITVVPGEKMTFQMAVTGEETYIVMPSAIVQKVPAARIAEHIDNMFETADKKRNEKPGVTI